MYGLQILGWPNKQTQANLTTTAKGGIQGIRPPHLYMVVGGSVHVLVCMIPTVELWFCL